MSKRGKLDWESFQTRLARRLVDEGLIGDEGGPEISVETVLRISRIEGELLQDKGTDAGPESGEVDAFQFYMFLRSRDPLPADPREFVRVYHRLREEFALDESFREDAEALAVEAVEFANRGTARFRLGRIPEALADFDRAVELAGDNAFVYATRAQALWETGNLEKALEDVEKAIELSRADTSLACEYLLFKADILMRMRAFAQAVPCVRKAAGELLRIARDPADGMKGFLLTPGVLLDEDFLLSLYEQIRELRNELSLEGEDTSEITSTLSTLRRALREKGPG
jgi:tetratricopeptide (TPR) repeat protein